MNPAVSCRFPSGVITKNSWVTVFFSLTRGVFAGQDRLRKFGKRVTLAGDDKRLVPAERRTFHIEIDRKFPFQCLQDLNSHIRAGQVVREVGIRVNQNIFHTEFCSGLPDLFRCLRNDTVTSSWSTDSTAVKTTRASSWRSLRTATSSAIFVFFFASYSIKSECMRRSRMVYSASGNLHPSS